MLNAHPANYTVKQRKVLRKVHKTETLCPMRQQNYYYALHK